MNILTLISGMLAPAAAQSVSKAAETTVPHVDLSPVAEQSTYFLARIVMQVVEWLLGLVGLEHNATIFLWVYSIVVFLIAWGVGIVVTAILLFCVRTLGKHWKSTVYHSLADADFFRKSAAIVPPLVFLVFIQFTLNQQHVTLAVWLTRLTWIYTIFLVCRSIAIVITVLWHHIDARENKKRLPLKGLVQLVKGIVWIVGVIVIIGILINKSPASLLAGLGAFAAVLMLVFKDSILGVVAGVQLSENDSLHVGDWIKVNGTDANGTVLEVSLTEVKVQNWDKTVTSLPPYTLISGSFTNYRSMQMSHTRRIERSYLIDADSIVPATDEMLAEYARIPLLKEWIETKIAQREAGHVEDVNNSAGLVNGSIETNMGVFRAYVQLYLNANPNIDKSSDCFVTTLQQKSTGVPFQVYCFTNTSAWFPYEAIQASIFEHIAVMLYRFNLYVFEYSTGRDEILEGYMSRGDNPPAPFGLPYPFFNNARSNPADPGKVSPSDAPAPHTDPGTTATRPGTGDTQS